MGKWMYGSMWIDCIDSFTKDCGHEFWLQISMLGNIKRKLKNKYKADKWIYL